MRSTPFWTASLFVLSLTVSLPSWHQPSLTSSRTRAPASEPHGHSSDPTMQMQQPDYLATRRGIPKRREGAGTRYV